MILISDFMLRSRTDQSELGAATMLCSGWVESLAEGRVRIIESAGRSSVQQRLMPNKAQEPTAAARGIEHARNFLFAAVPIAGPSPAAVAQLGR